MKTLSCIYIILNVINNKRYIGSAKDFKVRKYRHLLALRKNQHGNIFLQRAFNKYGEENFKFEIIAIVKDINDLIEREQFYLDLLKPEYNICKIAGSALGRKHTSEAILKMSIFQKHYFSIHGGRNKGKKFTIEHRTNLSKAKKGIPAHNKGIPRSLELKNRLSKIHLAKENIKSKQVVQLDLITNCIIKVWDKIGDAMRSLKKPYRNSIIAACAGRQNSAYGFKWMYKSDYDKLIQQVA